MGLYDPVIAPPFCFVCLLWERGWRRWVAPAQYGEAPLANIRWDVMCVCVRARAEVTRGELEEQIEENFFSEEGKGEIHVLTAEKVKMVS